VQCKWICLKDHQIRGCPVDEPPVKRCKREDDGVEDTYGYKLECYLKDLPTTVCCADKLPARVESRAQSFVVNKYSCDREGTHWVAFYFPKEGPAEFFNPRTATPVDSIAFTSSNTEIESLLWKISWMNSPLETQRRSRPNWKTFTNEFCV
jgi:hypothetical protein